MKKEIKLHDAIGKVFDGFDFSFSNGQAVLTFTDGTFSTLGIINQHEVGDNEIQESNLDLFNFGHDKLIALNIISIEELEEKSEQQRKQFVELKIQQERTLYEKLKCKFEN